MSSEFDVARFEALQRARGLELGSPFRHLRVTASTNDLALALARDGVVHGATFVADEQSAGRGRRGRHWFAAAGESLLCSVVLTSRLPPERVSLLALVAGLAVRSGIARLLGDASHDQRVKVKWPNDVWIDERKVAGVLCESHVRGSALAAAVVGFGVNVSTQAFPEELAHTATSLWLAGARVKREDLLVEILDGLAERSAILERDGEASVVDELSRHDALCGRRIRVEGVEGVAAGVDHSGGLLLRVSQDEMVTLNAGSVELVG